MIKLTATCLVSFLLSMTPFIAQISIMQEESLHYGAMGLDASQYEVIPNLSTKSYKNRSNCELNKIVYGWHPYWGGTNYLNYDWDLLTHMSFFSYEVNASTGNANTTNGWATSQAVNAALASGNTKVTLCVTLFSDFNTFFGSATAPQTLITNLINLVQTRGAHGVNIDFEGMTSTHKTNFANFMVNLANQMHAAIPGSEVSTVLYAVEWSDIFDFTIMNQAVDHYIVMGYDYYWSGSANAGPNDPLYHFGSTYNYTLSRSTSYYLHKGAPLNKLVLGLPYYGREWPTSSTTLGASTTGSGDSRTYAVVKNNASGNFSAANHQQETDSYTDVFVFNSGGTRQCYIALEDNFRKRLEHVNQSGIAGIGIWALGYDNGYNELWDAIEDYMTECYQDPCPAAIHDFGGPKNYYNNENYTWTVAPPGATSITLTFSSFDMETNYDYLYIYDGASIASPQVTGSPFSGTALPPVITSSGGALTFRFTSDNTTTRPGFVASYTCASDVTAPVSTLTVPSGWQTQDFPVSITDQDENDGSGVDKRFYQVLDFDGSDWRANGANGFFSDNFDQATIHADWTSAVGTWSLNNGFLVQSDEANGNTNVYASLNQNNHSQWLHKFDMRISGAGTNRRAGYHFMCDDGSLPNRGNSYFVWFRADNNKIQIYKVINDVFSLQLDVPYTINVNQWYSVDVVYNKTTGVIDVWLNNTWATSWTDATPLTLGNAISFRSGDCIMEANNLSVYHQHSGNPLVSVGSPTSDIRYQNTQPTLPSGRIKSLAIDGAKNISAITLEEIDVDWTAPTGLSQVNDGLSSDIQVFNVSTEISANWNTAVDPHSGVVGYEYAVGTSALATNVVNWTSNGLNTSCTAAGLSLTYGTTYFVSVRALNAAGLWSNLVSSDGQLLEEPNQPPVAGFQTANVTICSVDSIQLINTSTSANTFVWTSSTGSITQPTAVNPYITFPQAGTHSITLVASGPGGSDQITQNVTVAFHPNAVAQFSADYTTVDLPNAVVGFNNSSQQADAYFWDFGNGTTSTDQHPWCQFTVAGTYTVMLVAIHNQCANDTAYLSITVQEADVSGFENVGSPNIAVFPIPFDDRIMLNGLPLEGVWRVNLTDVSGRLVFQSAPFSGVDQLSITDVGFVSKGVYLLQLINNQHEVVQVVKLTK
jgi:spore germination protein YaaH/PKD repeat protein